jgi:hypothetical protein
MGFGSTLLSIHHPPDHEIDLHLVGVFDFLDQVGPAILLGHLARRLRVLLVPEFVERDDAVGRFWTVPLDLERRGRGGSRLLGKNLWRCWNAFGGDDDSDQSGLHVLAVGHRHLEGDLGLTNVFMPPCCVKSLCPADGH